MADGLTASCDLPVGAWVRFEPQPWRSDHNRSYVAKVAGYDDFRSKYRLSLRLYADVWTAPDTWAFPSEVAPITEGDPNG